MGMGNDDIDVSNSLDTDIQFNNSSVRDVNSTNGIDDMPDENTMGNSTGRDDGIHSEVTESPQSSPAAIMDDSGTMNNGELQAEGDKNNQNRCDSDTQNSSVHISAQENQTTAKVSLNKDFLHQCSAASPSPTKTKTGDGDSDTLDNSCPDDLPDGNINIPKISADDPDDNCQTIAAVPPPPAPPLPVYRNESLLRVSHLKRDWGGQRVTDIRTVSELMETFNSLEAPVIMPLPRQRDYYDQWARMPRCDVIQRLYPRAGSSVSSKCWALLQTIQSDPSQSKQNVGPQLMPSPASSPHKLAPPPSDVTCKSLDSIIEHYNTILHSPPVENIPRTPPPTTAATHRQAPIQNRTNSGSSRSSSGHSSSNAGNSGSNTSTKPDYGSSLKTALPKAKTSPIPQRQSKSIPDQSTNTYSNPKHSDPTQTQTNHRVKKSIFRDFELSPQCASDPSLSSVEIYDIAAAQRLTQMTSPGMIPYTVQEVRDNEVDAPDHAQSKCINVDVPQTGSNEPCDLLVPTSAREKRQTFEPHQQDPTDINRPATELLCYRDNARNPVGINTNTLNLSLPYERAQTVAEMHTSPTNSNKSRFTSQLEDNGNVEHERVKKPSEKHERFPLRSTAFISRGRRANTVLEYAQNKARLRNLTRTIPEASHTLKHLKDSLVIHEINCDLDNNNNSNNLNSISNEQQRKWEYPMKRRGRSSHHRAQPLGHKAPRAMPQLPDRMHSMLEQHLNLSPQTPSGESLSPLEGAPSRGHSAVSLASVHFLDLADLKNLLKKSNTTIPHL